MPASSETGNHARSGIPALDAGAASCSYLVEIIIFFSFG
jgi:hypothetical protein